MGCRIEKYNNQISYIFIAFNTYLFNWECASLLQFQYLDWLADQTGSEHLKTWRSKMKNIAMQQFFNNPDTYQDQWPNEDLHQEALLCLLKLNITR